MSPSLPAAAAEVDEPDLARIVGTLALLVALLVAGLWTARRLRLLPATALPRGRERRLAIVARTPIDARRHLVLVRRDDREHLLLLAPEGALLIEAGFFPTDAAPVPDLPGPSRQERGDLQ